MDVNIPTGIHTRVNDKYRISSIYRNWGIMLAPDLCGWETIVWCGKEIVHSEDSGNNASEVISRHAELYKKKIADGYTWCTENGLEVDA